jgi:hypothetical protein
VAPLGCLYAGVVLQFGDVLANVSYGHCRQPERTPKAMETVLRSLSVLALLAVVGVLLAGLWNMLRGRNPNLSQTLMRWRVGLQFLAIVVAMLLVYLLR